ncbi:MAG: aldo/keto reductase, partial [Nitrospirota bacterium]
MKYVHLGRSGLKVSRLCLGTMNFGPLASETESFAIMDRALELGINFFDTADVYGWELGEGITEELTSELSRNPFLFVIARNSAFIYKGRHVNVEDVGNELGVRYVLEGSVRKAGDRVRVTAQLIDATTGGHLWSERYDRALSDIFAL